MDLVSRNISDFWDCAK